MPNFFLTGVLVIIVAPAWKKYIIPTHLKLEADYVKQVNEEFGAAGGSFTVADATGEGGGGLAAVEEL